MRRRRLNMALMESLFLITVQRPAVVLYPALISLEHNRWTPGRRRHSVHLRSRDHYEVSQSEGSAGDWKTHCAV